MSGIQNITTDYYYAITPLKTGGGISACAEPV